MVIYNDCRNAASIPRIRDMDKIESMGSLESRQVNAVTLYNTNNKLNVHGFYLKKKATPFEQQEKQKQRKPTVSLEMITAQRHAILSKI
jgi:hypothetical protein